MKGGIDPWCRTFDRVVCGALRCDLRYSLYGGPVWTGLYGRQGAFPHIPRYVCMGGFVQYTADSVWSEYDLRLVLYRCKDILECSL